MVLKMQKFSLILFSDYATVKLFYLKNFLMYMVYDKVDITVFSN